MSRDAHSIDTQRRHPQHRHVARGGDSPNDTRGAAKTSVGAASYAALPSPRPTGVRGTETPRDGQTSSCTQRDRAAKDAAPTVFSCGCHWGRRLGGKAGKAQPKDPEAPRSIYLADRSCPDVGSFGHGILRLRPRASPGTSLRMTVKSSARGIS